MSGKLHSVTSRIDTGIRKKDSDSLLRPESVADVLQQQEYATAPLAEHKPRLPPKSGSGSGSRLILRAADKPLARNNSDIENVLGGESLLLNAERSRLLHRKPAYKAKA